MKNLKNLLFLDIETVSEHSSFDQQSEIKQSLWTKKSEFIRNEEALSSSDLYFEKAAIYAEFGKIVCVSVGILYHNEQDNVCIRIKAIHSDNEKELLEELIELINEKMNVSKIQLCGHNAKEFDFPYLCRRMIVHQIELPSYLQLSGKKPWEILHLDTMEMWKFGDWKSYTSLAILAELFGIPSPKDDISGKDVNRVYYLENGLERIAHYCNRDVLATAQVYLHISGFNKIQEENIHFVDDPTLP